MNNLERALAAYREGHRARDFDYAERAEGRSAGVLLPLFSLPSEGGIGCMDEEAFRFLDFLSEAGFRSWQLLPLSALGRDLSPYSSISGFGGEAAYISLTALVRDGLIGEADYRKASPPPSGSPIDYRWQWEEKDQLLRLAFCRFLEAGHEQEQAAFADFCRREASWLREHALFMALRRRYAFAPLQEWPQPLRQREAEALAKAREDESRECEFQSFLQYLFFSQWAQLRTYAKKRKIELIGDLPIYPAANSLEVWLYPQSFAVDKELLVLASGGCPPDENGFQQAWGNPVYHWEYEAAEGFPFWTRRVQRALSLYDLFRIDHFRGLEAFWKIPAKASDSSCREGWYKAPGRELFHHLYQSCPELRIIAEDLGYKTEAVRALRREMGIPGMRVLRYGFAPYGDSEHLPHQLLPDQVYYFSTHDDLPLKAWLDQASEEERRFASRYLHGEDLLRLIPDGMLASAAGRVIFQMQDLLLLGSDSRTNVPGSTQSWRWRLSKEACSPENYRRLAEDWQERLLCYGRYSGNT